MSIPTDHDLIILEKIESNPDSTQASLAAQLGVAIGTINWHIKRLTDKGYVKVRRVSRRKLRYLITQEGTSLMARLTIDYIQNQFKLFRLVRVRMSETVEQVRQAGYNRLRLDGEGDVAEVCRLTCLENGIPVVEDDNVPRVTICGLKMFVDFGQDGGTQHEPIPSPARQCE
jgi:DNA-binding MarR family transcriptional regulator